MYQALKTLVQQARERYAAMPRWEDCPCCGHPVMPKDDPAYQAWVDSLCAIDAEVLRLAANPLARADEIAVLTSRPYSFVALMIDHERERLLREESVVAC